MCDFVSLCLCVSVYVFQYVCVSLYLCVCVYACLCVCVSDTFIKINVIPETFARERYYSQVTIYLNYKESRWNNYCANDLILYCELITGVPANDILEEEDNDVEDKAATDNTKAANNITTGGNDKHHTTNTYKGESIKHTEWRFSKLTEK